MKILFYLKWVNEAMYSLHRVNKTIFLSKEKDAPTRWNSTVAMLSCLLELVLCKTGYCFWFWRDSEQKCRGHNQGIFIKFTWIKFVRRTSRCLVPLWESYCNCMCRQKSHKFMPIVMNIGGCIALSNDDPEIKELKRSYLKIWLRGVPRIDND